MSFLDQQQEAVRNCQGQEAGSVHILTQWAVDYMPSMCDTFRVNYPHAKVVPFSFNYLDGRGGPRELELP